MFEYIKEKAKTFLNIYLLLCIFLPFIICLNTLMHDDISPEMFGMKSYSLIVLLALITCVLSLSVLFMIIRKDNELESFRNKKAIQEQVKREYERELDREMAKQKSSQVKS